VIRDERNVIPISLAVLLHVVVFGSLVFALDISQRVQPITPMAITGTLVTEMAVVPPVIKQPEPEPVVEDEPQVEPEPEPEPEPPQPDPEEVARKQAEEKKRQEDARIEQERLQRIRDEEAEKKRRADEAERKRLADEAEKKRKAEEAERKRQEEAEKELQRIAAEKKREEDIRRQREENERLRREEEEAMRRSEIEAEEALTAARNSDDMARYMFALNQRVTRNWVRPASAQPGLECEVKVRQAPSGDVISVNVVSCNGDDAVVRSIEAAVRKASPLPLPGNPILFEPDLRFVFKPEQ
jgi:colicin import membrane protein